MIEKLGALGLGWVMGALCLMIVALLAIGGASKQVYRFWRAWKIYRTEHCSWRVALILSDYWVWPWEKTRARRKG